MESNVQSIQFESPNPRIKVALMLVAWVVLCFSASFVGILFSPGEWYSQLNKPPWNPPSWLFGPVWTALYLMMGVAVWLVWKQGGFKSQRQPLSIFFVQLALNAAWSPLFFGLHNPGLAFVEILLMWCAIVATIIAFWKVNRWAALLLAPYLAWVSFASVLNFTLWRMN